MAVIIDADASIFLGRIDRFSPVLIVERFDLRSCVSRVGQTGPLRVCQSGPLAEAVGRGDLGPRAGGRGSGPPAPCAATTTAGRA